VVVGSARSTGGQQRRRYSVPELLLSLQAARPPRGSSRDSVPTRREQESQNVGRWRVGSGPRTLGRVGEVTGGRRLEGTEAQLKRVEPVADQRSGWAKVRAVAGGPVERVGPSTQRVKSLSVTGKPCRFAISSLVHFAPRDVA